MVPHPHGKKLRVFQERAARFEFYERNIIELNRQNAEQEYPTAECLPPERKVLGCDSCHLLWVRHTDQRRQLAIDADERTRVRPHLIGRSAEMTGDRECSRTGMCHGSNRRDSLVFDLPTDPPIYDIKTKQKSHDNPPRFARCRGVLIQDISLAIGAARNIFVNWPLAIGTRHCAIVIALRIVPRGIFVFPIVVKLAARHRTQLSSMEP